MIGSILWRRVRMHFGISAPRMTVRTALPWWERGAALAAIVVTVVVVSWWVLSASPSTAASRAADESRLSVSGGEASRLREDIGRLRVQSSQLESDLLMSRSAQDALSRQVAELTAENAKLKEDATTLRRLLTDAAPSGAKAAAPARRP